MLIPLENLLAFTAVAVVLIIVPGPSVLFVIGRALSRGQGAALTTAFGNAVGSFIPAAVVAVGLGPVFERSAMAFTALKLIGAAYLVYLGATAWRDRHKVSAPGADGAPQRKMARTFADGFAVGATNPKTIVFFAAVLPQFVAPGSGHATAQMLTLGLVAAALALVFDSGWALAAGSARKWFAGSPRRMSLIGGAGGLTMIGLGVGVAATGRPD
ncbi:LysE family translocator [Nocardiopsis coralliicola]